MERIVVTGGAGFIGSALVRQLIAETAAEVCVIDKLTYAGNLDSLAPVADDPRYRFEHCDICDRDRVREIFDDFQPDVVMHLAAESHVDRSIDGPSEFIHTNIVGTYELLEAARRYWEEIPAERRDPFRFLHISTDEVYGSLGAEGFFLETTPYQPTSPYSGSKASSDHLVRAWHHTYGLPTLITNCSNNYGPYHFPEKLIPLVILNALEKKTLPVYGKGENIRDWLYVDDHASALRLVAERGRPGETYNVGSNNEQTNLAVVEQICSLMDELAPGDPGFEHASLITFVTDRPGHDLRYAIDATKIRTELGFQPEESFSSGLRKTVAWYLENRSWWERIRSGTYQGERLGLGGGG